MYCLNLLETAVELSRHDDTYQDLATKFFEHFAYIADAMNRRGLWDDGDGFYYDVYSVPGGDRVPLKVRSMVGLLPLCATTTIGRDTLDRLPAFEYRFHWFVTNKGQFADAIAHTRVVGGKEGHLLAVVDPERLVRMLRPMLDEAEFLSPFGLRALSARHRDHPFTLRLDGIEATVDYEPGESTTDLFGGNSNWRGPVWFPVNYLLIEALGRFANYLGDDVRVEHPTGSAQQRTLRQVASDLAQRLVTLFRSDEAGHRPVFGDERRFDRWPGLVPFHEYFHGDSGKGLGASHQTGWTGLVADLVIRGSIPAPTGPR
jgi:hypothetical protein